MGFSLNNMMDGYKKVKNDKNYTLESLLAILETAEFSIGRPSRGEIAEKPAIVFEPHDNMVVYIYVSPKDIQISRTTADHLGKHLVKELAFAALTDVAGNATAAADRAVNEVYEVIRTIMEKGIAVNNNSKAAAYKLYMEQKIISIRDKFSIFREDETPAYWVQGSLTGLSFKMKDNEENERLEIKKKLVAILPEYTICKKGKKIGELKKKIKLTKPEIAGDINGRKINVTGDLNGYHFSIKADGAVIGNVDTERMTFGDVYAIEIVEPDDEELAVAIAVIVDNVIAAAEK